MLLIIVFFFFLLLLEIPNFLTDEECQTIIDLASGEGLDTSEVQDPETGVNIEPTNEQTFNSWDYNHDGVIDKVEVQNIKANLKFSETCHLYSVLKNAKRIITVCMELKFDRK